MSSQKMWWWMTVSLITVVVVTAVGFQLQKNEGVPSLANNGTIKIGVVLPLTNDAAAYGVPMQKAASLAVEEINSNQGIAGHNIEVWYEDGGCDSQKSAAAIKKLTQENDIKIVFGGACSSETLAMAPIAEANKILLISPSATSLAISQAGDYVFRTTPSDNQAGQIAAQYALKNLKAKTVAIISEPQEYSQGLRDVFKKSFLVGRGLIVADEVLAQENISKQIAKIKSANPGIIYFIPQTPASGLKIIKEITKQKITTQLLTAEVMVSKYVAKVAPEEVNGIIGVEQYYPTDSKYTQDFIKNYQARYSESPAFPAYMANIYSQFYLIKSAIEGVGADNEKIKNYLYQLKDWEQALGKLTFDKNGDRLTNYAILKVEKGALKQLEISALGK